MFGIDRKTASVTWTAALMLGILAVVYAIRATLVIFAVALLFAYLLSPLVDLIARRFPAKHRNAALGLTYVLVIGVLGAVGFFIGSRVADQARQLIAQPPDIKGFFAELKQSHPALSPEIEAVESHINQQLGGLASVIPRYSLRVLSEATNLIFLVVIPILSFFMLKDGDRIQQSFLALLSSSRSRARTERAIAAIHDLLLKYMRALLVLCCNVLIVYSVVLSVMRVPYSLLLASVAFFCEFVPLVGPLIATIVIVVAAALGGYPHILWIIVFLATFRLVQDYVISPKLMGAGVEVDPIWVLFGVFAGEQIGGVAGVFLSVPTLALIRLLLDQVVWTGKN